MRSIDFCKRERLRDGKYQGAPGRERERGDTGRGRTMERELGWPAGFDWKRWWGGTGGPGTGRWREREGIGDGVRVLQKRGKIFHYTGHAPARVRASKNNLEAFFSTEPLFKRHLTRGVLN